MRRTRPDLLGRCVATIDLPEDVRVDSRGVGRGVPSPEILFYISMVKWRILGVNFKFYSMNKTVKIHQNPADTSEYDMR